MTQAVHGGVCMFASLSNKIMFVPFLGHSFDDFWVYTVGVVVFVVVIVVSSLSVLIRKFRVVLVRRPNDIVSR